MTHSVGTVSNLGTSSRAPEGTTGSAFGGGVIVFENTVHRRASNLEHQMHIARRSPYPLLGVALRRDAGILVNVHPGLLGRELGVWGDHSFTSTAAMNNLRSFYI
jgi:hypothetical protein